MGTTFSWKTLVGINKRVLHRIAKEKLTKVNVSFLFPEKSTLYLGNGTSDIFEFWAGIQLLKKLKFQKRFFRFLCRFFSTWIFVYASEHEKKRNVTIEIFDQRLKIRFFSKLFSHSNKF